MNWAGALLWGFAATVILTLFLSGSRGLGLTRMDISFMLGTMFTANRDRAKWIGFLFHMVNGWIFAFIYVAAFVSTGLLHWWFGMAIGLVHALFVLTAGMPMLPTIHPRMATEEHGPDPTRQLEPPGFMALHYGKQTPLASIAAHMLYGGVLGLFYH
jgi:hypothetical protein